MTNVPPSDEPCFLDGGALAFRTMHGRLEMQRAGEETWAEIALARLFPVTDPDAWFAVLNKDDKELGILKDLKGLVPDSLASVRHELHRRYMIPEIRRVVTCRTKFDLVEWDVETNRGRVTFRIKQHQDRTQASAGNRLAITDIEGNRYDVPDVSTLDAESQRVLGEWF